MGRAQERGWFPRLEGGGVEMFDSLANFSPPRDRLQYLPRWVEVGDSKLD